MLDSETKLKDAPFALTFDEYIECLHKVQFDKVEGLIDKFGKEISLNLSDAVKKLSEKEDVEAAFVLLYEGTGRYRSSDYIFESNDLEAMLQIRKRIKINMEQAFDAINSVN